MARALSTADSLAPRDDPIAPAARSAGRQAESGRPGNMTIPLIDPFRLKSEELNRPQERRDADLARTLLASYAMLMHTPFPFFRDLGHEIVRCAERTRATLHWNYRAPNPVGGDASDKM